MSRRNRKSQSVTVATPVVESEVSTAVVETVENPAAVVDTAEAPVAPVEAAAAPAEAAVAADTPVAVAKTKKYPRVGGKCWQVWNACDELVAAGTHPTVKHLRDHAVANNWNVSNASQEFYAWRKYHGRV
jgi:hypothetical protein